MKRVFTLNETIENHRKMWREISRILKEGEFEDFNGPNLPRIKTEALRNAIDKDYSCNDLMHNCFLCEYVSKLSYKSCCFCPLQDEDNLNQSCLNGLYDSFFQSLFLKDYELSGDIALKIANLNVINKEIIK